MRLRICYDYWKKGESILATAAVLLFFLSISPCSSRGQEVPGASEARNDNYRIGPGDVIDIIVNKNDILSRSGVRVSNQGTIQLAMMDNEISAACLTEKELADQIKEKYKKYLVKPYVLVAVREFNSTPIALIGAVNSPKHFQMQRPMRVLDVLTLGDGPNRNAGTKLQVIRNPEAHNCPAKNSAAATADAGEQLVDYELTKVLKGDDQSNPFVQPGDVIRVIEAEEAKQMQAYIIGNVISAKTIDLKERVTLTQAIAMAGGPSAGAQLDKVKVSRQIPGTLSKSQIIVNLKEVNKRNEGDIFLEPNDIIDVPGPSGSKKFLGELFRGIIPSMTRLPIPIP